MSQGAHVRQITEGTVTSSRPIPAFHFPGGYGARGRVMSEKIAMTELDIAAAKCLSACIFPVASYNKRFARSIRGIAVSDSPELTPKQMANLWRLVWMYRRQIDNVSVLAEASRRKVERRGNEAKQPTPDHVKKFWVTN